MKYVKYVNNRYKALTEGEVYEVLDESKKAESITIRNDYGDIQNYPWNHHFITIRKNYERNFIHIPSEEIRNQIITEILE